MRNVFVVLAFLIGLVGCGGSTPPPTAPAPVFQREEVKGLGDPEVVVVNMANRPIRVTLAGPKSETLTIEAMQTARAKVPVGGYRYRAETKGAKAFDGEQEFGPDGRYTWTFVIVRNMPAPSEALVSELKKALSTGRLEGARFEGAGVGEDERRAPPGGTPGQQGWLTYPSGWGVQIEARRIANFRFGRNVLSELLLFERADVETLLGPPDDEMKTNDGSGGTIIAYTSRRAAFLVESNGEVAMLMLLR